MSYQISGCTHPAIWRPGLNQRERPIRDLAESVSILFIRGHLAARARAFEHPMQMVRILAQRDHVHSNTVLLERELAIETQPNNASTTRRRNNFERLQFMRLRGWSCKETAARFATHPNTIQNWRKSLRDKHKLESVVDSPQWNKPHCGLRWIVQEMR